MVETLLILARADAGQLSLTLKNTDFRRSARRLLGPVSSSRPGPRPDLQWQISAPIFIETDPEKLRIVLHNIFDNAVSYADDRGAIRVAAELKQDRLLIEIANSGSVIPPDKTSQLFDRFWRGDQARTQTGVHCGLGLSLCQRLARLLNGKIEIQSTARNWFIVRFFLPASPTDSSRSVRFSARHFSADATTSGATAGGGCIGRGFLLNIEIPIISRTYVRSISAAPSADATAAARCVRRIPVKQLAQLAQPSPSIYSRHGAIHFEIFVDVVVGSPVRFQIRRRQRTQQPRVNRSLMLRPLARRSLANIFPLVSGLAPRQAPQPLWRQQFLHDPMDHRLMPLRRQHRVRQADGEYLVGPHRRIQRRRRPRHQSSNPIWHSRIAG